MNKKQLKLSKEKNDAIVRVAQALGRAYWKGAWRSSGYPFDEDESPLQKAGEICQGSWYEEARKALKL